VNIIKVLRAAGSLVRRGPLVQDGWVRSYIEGQSVDLDGTPIPWITYPAIDFLTERLPKLENVFEYGSGNGTLWWATKSERVRAVENDPEWYEKMRKFLPRNVELYFEDISTGTGYEEKVLVDECYYDVIVIDGRHRNNCMTQSLKRIKPNGIIILDNSDRTEYAQGIHHLTTSGFRMIEFSGFCPIVNFKSKTAIFYRSQNILGI
jgi:hypothetical protein